MIPGLLVTEGPKRGIYIHLPEATPFWLGRLPEADFMLEEDTKVSGKHCFFLRQGSLLELTDESRNGTRVNGNKILQSRISLQNADIIRVGASHFQVVNMDQAQLDITRVSDEDTSPNQEEANIEACFKAVEQRQDPLHPSKVFDGFGDYLAIDIIGKGGTGIVYKAIDKKNQKVIALKIFPNLEELGESFLSRFRREIKLLEKLNHQSIIKLYDTGTFEKEEETFHYIALEYFQGVSLKDHVRSLSLIHKAPTPMHWHKVFRVLLQISHALHYMHSQGVLHRDIKPDNIMYDDMKGISKIIDLGLGKCIVEEEQRQTLFTTQPNSALGTPHYMSIEQWYDTKDVDERADIYSLGATAYFLLSARIPYGEHIELRTLYRAVLKRELTPITELCKNKVPAPFLAIIQKMMAFEAANRYSSCQGICEDLNKYVNQYPQDFKSI